MAKITTEDVLKKLSSAELKVLHDAWNMKGDIDDEVERRKALKTFKAQRLIDVADLLEGKGKFKNRGVANEKFNMDTFLRLEDGASDTFAQADSATKAVEMGCGFAACACGHAGLQPEFRRQGFFTTKSGEDFEGRTYHYEDVHYKDRNGSIHHDFDAASEFFGIVYSDAENLFSYHERLGKKGNTPSAVAKRIRDFVKAQKVQADAIARMDKKVKESVARKAAARKAKKVTVTEKKAK